MTGCRFQTLDGLRGVAAAAVVVMHCASWGLLPDYRGHAYLAVDLFFMISGFVVAHAYDERLQAGMGLGEFARVRLIRLWPLHAAGMITGAAALCAAAAMGAPLMNAGGPIPLGLITAMGLIFVPLLIPGSAFPAFAANGPAWSLSVEVFGNLAYAAGGWRLSDRRMMAAVVVGAALLGFFAAHGGNLDIGPRAGDHFGAYARMLYGFGVGVLIQRRRAAGRPPPPAIPPGVIYSLLLLVLWAPPIPVLGGVTDLVIVLGLLPALVAMATVARMERPGLAGALGTHSYALYALHTPFLMLAAGIAKAAGLGPGPRTILAAVAVAAAAAAAVAATRHLDPAVRRGLERILPRHPRVAPSPA